MYELYEIKRNIFWNINLSTYEKDTLRKAGFRNPAAFLDVPVIALMRLDGFGFVNTCDLLEALSCYYDFSQDVFDGMFDTVDEEYDDYDYIPNEFSLSFDDEMDIRVSNILYALNIIDESRICRMTCREILTAVGEDVGLLQCFAETIFNTYYKTYAYTDYVFSSKNDIAENIEKLFEKKRCR